MTNCSTRWTRNSDRFLFSILFFATIRPSVAFDSLNNFCSRWYQQSVVKNNVLYVDGGFQTFTEQGATGPYPLGYNNVLIEIPLSDSWDWKSNITTIAINKPADPKTGAIPPSLNGGAMFQGSSQANGDEVYIYGGTYFEQNSTFGNVSPDSPTSGLWSYSKGSNSWKQYDIAATVRPSRGAYAEAPDQGLGFYVGGQIDGGSQPGLDGLGNSSIGLQGMVVLNTTETPKARNISTTDLSPDGLVNSGLVYIAAIADKGILVSLGGASKPTGVASEANNTLVTFDTVGIFDIASIYNNGSGKWLKQKTTGTGPDPRIDFCTIAVSAIDNSSHNIYVYGGQNPNSGTAFDDIYVLSLPSFIWIKIYQGESPRYGHTCHLVAPRQMITTGGISSGPQLTNTTGTCDWHTKGVGVLNLSTKIWGSIFDAHAPPYEVTKEIVDVIGGSTRGGSPIKAPKDGYSSPQLTELFAGPKSSTSGSTPSGTGSSSQTSPPASKKSHAGAIAGGIIGALLGVGLIACGALFFLRRRKQSAAAVPVATDSEMQAGSTDKDGDISELAAPSSNGGECPELSAVPVKDVVVVEVHELDPAGKEAELEGDTTSLPSNPAHPEELIGQAHPEELIRQTDPEELIGQTHPEELMSRSPPED